MRFTVVEFTVCAGHAFPDSSWSWEVLHNVWSRHIDVCTVGATQQFLIGAFRHSQVSKTSQNSKKQKCVCHYLSVCVALILCHSTDTQIAIGQWPTGGPPAAELAVQRRYPPVARWSFAHRFSGGPPAAQKRLQIKGHPFAAYYPPASNWPSLWP